MSGRQWLGGLVAALLPVALSGCADEGAGPPAPAPAEIASPAGPGSAEPHLFAAPDGRVYMSWLEPVRASEAGPARSTMPAGTAYALRFAVHRGDGWSEPRTVVEGDDFFVNWADFPSLVELPDGRLAAHWLQREGESTYAYGIRISQSDDGGESWSEPTTPHRDGTLTEHGFVSLFPRPDGALGAVWLDGRKYAEGADEMTLRYASLDARGTTAEERLLDGRICDCCQTDAALAEAGPVVVYRDRDADEIRDIYVVRHTAAGWSAPQPVHRDGWRIPACPVNGPAIDADRTRLAVAWFTGAPEGARDMDEAAVRESARNPQGRVLVAFSEDGGSTFGAPVRVDDGDPAGRVDIVLLPDGDALVTWVERLEETGEVRTRVVTRDGRTGPARTVTRSGAARASGFPQLVRAANALFFAWTVPGDPSRVRTARAEIGTE